MTRARRRPAFALLAASATVLLATACGVQTPGAASVVGDQRVTDAQLGDATAEVQTELAAAKKPYDAAKVTNANVTRMTTSLLLAAAATQQGITVTPTDVDRLLTTSAAQAGGMAQLDLALLTADSVPSSAVDSYAQDFLINSALLVKFGGSTPAGNAALAKYLTKLSTDLSASVAARYGTWDPAKLSVGPVPTNLAVPVVGNTPRPSATLIPSDSPSPSASPNP